MSRFLCWLFGHKFPVTWVGIMHGEIVSYGMGTCKRCGVVAIPWQEAARCADCNHLIVEADDDTRFCLECGGMSHRAVTY